MANDDYTICVIVASCWLHVALDGCLVILQLLILQNSLIFQSSSSTSLGAARLETRGERGG
jgi:hypothetical protein